MSFTVILEPEAEADLEAIKDMRTYEAIESELDELETEPRRRGKQLRGHLKKYRSLKPQASATASSTPWKYLKSEEGVNVFVIGIRKEGDKKDAYAVARKRLG